METYPNIICPVSPDSINENAARINAFFTVAIVGLALYLNNYFISLILGFDFSLRTFSSGLYSPLRFMAKQLTSLLRLGMKPINARPKRFAAGVGMVFSLLIASFQILDLSLYANIAAVFFIFFALLEGGLGFCMGCYIYTYFVLPFKSK